MRFEVRMTLDEAKLKLTIAGFEVIETHTEGPSRYLTVMLNGKQVGYYIYDWVPDLVRDVVEGIILRSIHRGQRA